MTDTMFAHHTRPSLDLAGELSDGCGIALRRQREIAQI
jgi:hypothetical protein